MSSLMNSLGIDRLPTDEQLRLVGEILDELPEHALTEAQRRELDRHMERLDPEGRTPMVEEPLPLTEAQKQVFQRRIDDLQANPSIGLTWEQIKEHVKGGR
jgi:putative addiction module component (TIGR02574 family)